MGVDCLPMNQGMNPYRAPTTQSLSQEVERDWKWLCFSFEGRATRGDYWKGTLLLFVPLFLIAAAAGIFIAIVGGASEGESADPNIALMIVFGIVGLAALVPFVWASLAIAVKRWHDRNKSGAWVLIGMIPYIGSLWVFVECGCLRGTEGANTYGADPLA
jgi:uncharacterized membrane protein YhaH (DUF805 family)